MALIDTNIILYLIDGSKPKLTSVAANLLAEQPDNSVIVSEAVLAECFYVLCGRQFGFNRAHASQVIANVVQQPVFKDTTHLLAACRLFSDTKLDIADCLLVARSQQMGQPILTQDKALLRANN